MKRSDNKKKKPSLSIATEMALVVLAFLALFVIGNAVSQVLLKDVFIKNAHVSNFAVVAIAFACCLAAFWLVQIRIIRPAKQISDEANRFAESKAASADSLEKIMARDNELGQLATSVYAMEYEIVDSIESIKKLSSEQERVNAELDIASKIQEAALPHEFPAFPEKTEFDVFALMGPAKEVGGDFYDFFLIDDDHLALVMADVSDKGVPAALFMMVSKVAIENHLSLLTEPAQVLSAVNNKIASSNEMFMFVTAWLGILEISTGVMTCCNAGHDYPMLRRSGGAFELLRDDHGIALGLLEDAPYTQYTVQMDRDDVIFVYTDGVPEARNSNGEFYGTKRLADALNECPEAPAQFIVEHLKNDVVSFVGDAAQFDDLTVLALRYLGSER